MKLKGIFILGLLITSFGFTSCYYDKADLLYPGANAPCTTVTSVSYAQDVVPLLQQYCYSCHSGGSPSGGIAMGTYATDKTIALNGKLYGSINYSSGFSPMPQGSPKFSSCQLATVKLWIDNNTPNN